MKYLAFYNPDSEYIPCDTIEEARSKLRERYEEGILLNEDIKDCIYELKETVKFTQTDKKENYKYTDYDDLKEGDEDDDVWPYDNEYDTIYDITFDPFI